MSFSPSTYIGYLLKVEDSDYNRLLPTGNKIQAVATSFYVIQLSDKFHIVGLQGYKQGG